MLGDSTSTAKVQEIVRQGWGVDIGETDARRIAELADYYGGDRSWAFGEVLSRTRSFIGWSTHGHTGGDVPLAAFGVGKPENGVYGEAELGRFFAETLGLNMKNLTDRLFVDAAEAFAGGSVSVVPEVADGREVGYSLRVECNGKTAEFFANKNVALVDGEPVELEGVACYNRGNGIFYVPAQGARLVTGSAALPEIGGR
jgi:alkaline phosphatase